MRSRFPFAGLSRPLLLGAAALLCAATSGAVAASGDSYLLALTWQPGFCSGKHAKLAECAAPAEAKPRFTLHGLWPDWDANGDGRQNADDAYCLPGESGRKAILELEALAPDNDWRKLPEVTLSPASRSDLAAVMPGTRIGLERHEWWKHGTCSGLQPDAYFAIAILLVRQAERGGFVRLVTANAGKTLDRNALLGAFTADFGPNSARALMLDCARIGGVSALMEIRIRLKRDTIAEGLNADGLAIPAKAPKGDCAARILIPGGGS
jgi:ribonuclease T2